MPCSKHEARSNRRSEGQSQRTWAPMTEGYRQRPDGPGRLLYEARLWGGTMAPRFAYRLPIDVRELCVPITSCVTVSLGPIQKDVLEQLERAGYDQAPVLGAAGDVIGIVDTVRLRELLGEDRILA